MLLQGKSIDGYLHEGSMVGFSCHGFDQSGQDQCGYFVTMAWHHDPGAADNAKIIHGIYSARGRVSEVSHRHGVITYVDTNGELDIYLDLRSSGRTLRNLK